LVRLGRSGWLMTGIVAGLAATIVAIAVLLPYLTPVIFAVVLAAVLAPMVDWLCRKGLRRVVASIIAALTLPVVVILLIVVVMRSLRGQATEWQGTAGSAAAQVKAAIGTDPLTPVLDAAQRGTVLRGVAGLAIQGTAAVVATVFGFLIAVYILFFLLKDGPQMVSAVAARLPYVPATARELLAGAGLRLRRYVAGTTVVAAMDAIVISLGAVVLRLPLVLVIALVTFATAYVPYLGAWLSAIFAVVVALGAGGPDAAVWMLAIVLLTQNVFEGLLRPYAFGVALDMHPLAVLAVTVVGAVLGGFIGVFIAPPLAAIAVFWVRTVRAGPR